MTNTKVLYYFKEQLEWLETRSYLALEKWVLSMLRDNESYPLFISFDAITPSGILQDFFERSKNNDFKSKLKRIIIDLVSDWRMDRDPDTMLFELTILVGHLSIARARSKLLSLVKEGYLRNRKYRDIDLHFHLLRVLAGLKLSTDLKLIIQRDFDSPSYAPILFTSSWLLSEKGFFFTIELLDRFIDLHKKYPHQMEFYPPMRAFLKRFGGSNLQKYYKMIKNKLRPENVRYFRDCLEETGFDTHFIEDPKDREKRGVKKKYPPVAPQLQYVRAPTPEYDALATLKESSAEIFKLMGFEVELNRKIANHTIDFFAKRKKSFTPSYECWICICDTANRNVSKNTVDDFVAVWEPVKKELQKQTCEDCQTMIISGKGFTKTAIQAAKTQKIVLKTYNQLFFDLTAFHNHQIKLTQDFETLRQIKTVEGKAS
jgi:hypothetical protein